MPLLRSRGGAAGRNPRRLAWQRRWRALECWLGAAISFLLPFGLETLVRQWFQPAPGLLSPDRWLLYLYGICWAIALASLLLGFVYWRKAQLAAQGALGEKAVARELQPLVDEGWQLDYGVAVRAVGDVDIICTSPRGRVLTVDVKSHGGTVIALEGKLYRQYGRQRYKFEKDFLAQAMQQALQVKRLRSVAFVTPLVVFSRAQVRVGPGKLRGVYVTSLGRAAGLLRSLG